MPKVSQAHLDARRLQILDAARARFATHGFAGTSMTDLVTAAGLSIGAIYRYFPSKDDLIVAICQQADDALPADLTEAALTAFLDHVRSMERDHGHARLVAQIYAEAAVSAPLRAIVDQQLVQLRAAVARLLVDHGPEESARRAEAFVAVCGGYSQQLAVRGDVDPAPFVAALMLVVASS